MANINILKGAIATYVLSREHLFVAGDIGMANTTPYTSTMDGNNCPSGTTRVMSVDECGAFDHVPDRDGDWLMPVTQTLSESDETCGPSWPKTGCFFFASKDPITHTEIFNVRYSKCSDPGRTDSYTDPNSDTKSVGICKQQTQDRLPLAKERLLNKVRRLTAVEEAAVQTMDRFFKAMPRYLDHDFAPQTSAGEPMFGKVRFNYEFSENKETNASKAKELLIEASTTIGGDFKYVGSERGSLIVFFEVDEVEKLAAANEENMACVIAAIVTAAAGLPFVVLELTAWLCPDSCLLSCLPEACVTCLRCGNDIELVSAEDDDTEDYVSAEDDGSTISEQDVSDTLLQSDSKKTTNHDSSSFPYILIAIFLGSLLVLLCVIKSTNTKLDTRENKNSLVGQSGRKQKQFSQQKSVGQFSFSSDSSDSGVEDGCTSSAVLEVLESDYPTYTTTDGQTFGLA